MDINLNSCRDTGFHQKINILDKRNNNGGNLVNFPEVVNFELEVNPPQQVNIQRVDQAIVRENQIFPENQPDPVMLDIITRRILPPLLENQHQRNRPNTFESIRNLNNNRRFIELVPIMGNIIPIMGNIMVIILSQFVNRPRNDN